MRAANGGLTKDGEALCDVECGASQEQIWVRDVHKHSYGDLIYSEPRPSITHLLMAEGAAHTLQLASWECCIPLAPNGTQPPILHATASQKHASAAVANTRCKPHQHQGVDHESRHTRRRKSHNKISVIEIFTIMTSATNNHLAHMPMPAARPTSASGTIQASFGGRNGQDPEGGAPPISGEVYESLCTARTVQHTTRHRISICPDVGCELRIRASTLARPQHARCDEERHTSVLHLVHLLASCATGAGRRQLRARGGTPQTRLAPRAPSSRYAGMQPLPRARRRHICEMARDAYASKSRGHCDAPARVSLDHDRDRAPESGRTESGGGEAGSARRSCLRRISWSSIGRENRRLPDWEGYDGMLAFHLHGFCISSERAHGKTRELVKLAMTESEDILSSKGSVNRGNSASTHHEQSIAAEVKKPMASPGFS
ncbi:hypothetical protein CERSUDRAFT_78669 [Gelatoporia subvermispora B]|uniref:Uncharacterized protein n=1 Tax=Ceriporiopsis subvermispora (strain B) TaxID=914234 RepID=M2P617_CERS8|nr:hypothetical protein CERSUDRAFT_78669 [Gelatoporia subvermispora B]